MNLARTPVPPRSIMQKDGRPIGVVVDNPHWDPIRMAAVLKSGRLCKRCVKRGKVDGCYQHRVTSGAEVRILQMEVGTKWVADDGRIGTYLGEGQIHYE